MSTRPGSVWGPQYPFERQHLQRSLTLIGLGGVVATVIVVQANAHPARALGTALVLAGLLLALAAASRHRYVRETRLGFAVLTTRDGRFVVGSALGLVVAAVFVALLVLV